MQINLNRLLNINNNDNAQTKEGEEGDDDDENHLEIKNISSMSQPSVKLNANHSET